MIGSLRRASLGALAAVVAVALVVGSSVLSADGPPTVRVAVFEVAGLPWARPLLAARLAASGAAVPDAGLTDAAARGAGYSGALSQPRDDWRRLGAVVGVDAIAVGAGSVVEREADNDTTDWDGFLALFLVDGRTGELLSYKGLRSRGPDRARVEEELKSAARELGAEWVSACAQAVTLRERGREAVAVPEVDLVAAPDAPGVTPPRFFKRPVPEFTADADRAHAVATVDLAVTFNADGSYGPIEVLRWGGFGLDESSVAAVLASRFYPARKDGKAVAARALLRFNFRFRDK